MQRNMRYGNTLQWYRGYQFGVAVIFEYELLLSSDNRTQNVDCSMLERILETEEP